MESPEKNASGVKRPWLKWVILGVVAAVSATVFFVLQRSGIYKDVLPIAQRFSVSGPKNIPALKVTVKLFNADKTGFEGKSAIGFVKGGEADLSKETAQGQRCPRFVAGDFGQFSVAVEPTPDANADANTQKNPLPDCAPEADWLLAKATPAYTVFFNKGEEFVNALATETSPLRQLLEKPVFSGLFQDWNDNLRVSGDDLAVSDLKGVLVKSVVAEALKAQAQLHIDTSHGSKGYVFSFAYQGDGNHSAAAARFVGLAIDHLALRKYNVVKLSQPVFELLVGTQRVFIGLYGPRIYLGNSLEGLLNVMDYPLETTPVDLDTTITWRLRNETIFQGLLPILFGKDTWHVDLAANVSRQELALKKILMDDGTTFQFLQESSRDDALLKVMPADIAALISFRLKIPPTVELASWSGQTSVGKWPYSMEQATSSMDLVVGWDVVSTGTDKDVVANLQNQMALAFRFVDGKHVAKDKAAEWFAHVELVDSCGDVTFASDADGLFTRMKEACGGKNASLVGLLPASDKTTLAQAYVNPMQFAREAYRAGGGEGLEQADLDRLKSSHNPDLLALQQAKAMVWHEAAAVFDSFSPQVFNLQVATVQQRRFWSVQAAPQVKR